MDAKRNWKFKHKLLRYACSKSKLPCHHTQCAAHGASLGIPQQPPVPPCNQQQPQRIPSAPAGLGQMHHPGHADVPRQAPTLTHFILSQQCKRWRPNVATSPTLSQPDSDKLLPVTCNLPGTHCGLCKEWDPSSHEETFHLFISLLPPSSVSKQHCVVISSSAAFPLLSQKCREKAERGG